MRPPPPDVATVSRVLRTKRSAQRGLFVQHDEQMAGEEKESDVCEKQNRLIEDRSASKEQSDAEIHRISDKTIGTTRHKPVWRSERRGSASSDEGEAGHARERDGRASRTDDHSGDLEAADCRRPVDCRKETGGDVDQDEPNRRRRMKRMVITRLHPRIGGL